MPLSLTRRRGDQIVIGDDTIIRVVDVGRGDVRIEIESPRQVLRGELLGDDEFAAIEERAIYDTDDGRE